MSVGTLFGTIHTRRNIEDTIGLRIGRICCRIKREVVRLEAARRTHRRNGRSRCAAMALEDAGELIAQLEDVGTAETRARNMRELVN